ncbi:MAG: hypothetical protein QJR12_01825 [Mycobacterium sp.]|uniref:hypothetical protein n=1 Tax=Mycobacterium sp. TaxID=1785 RepID=UPI0026261F84|nr:hypothetical protein [Mycobacterium sp.]MDI3313048.1 hypothetical protein [Mycobacterium sp.]
MVGAAASGAIRLQADPGPAGPLGLPSVDAHSSYWNPGNKALDNIRVRVAVVVLVAAVLAGGCAHSSPLGPPIPTGATIIEGPDVYPPPPPGWKQHPVIPKHQQQAQDTILGYLKKTLRALPAGTTLDATLASPALRAAYDKAMGKMRRQFTLIQSAGPSCRTRSAVCTARC